MGLTQQILDKAQREAATKIKVVLVGYRNVAIRGFEIGRNFLFFN